MAHGSPLLRDMGNRLTRNGEGHDFQSWLKSRKINAALAAEVRSGTLNPLFPAASWAGAISPYGKGE